METERSSKSFTRRGFVRASVAAAAGAMAAGGSVGRAEAANGELGARAVSDATGSWVASRPLLTASEEFRDVSRGDPKIYLLKGDDLVRARLTPETWRLEITSDARPNPAISEVTGISRPLTLAAGTALDFSALVELGKTRGVRFLKAMQCLNIPSPLGQGLWEGVPLREVLKLCGTLKNARRIYYWGYHNNDPKQIFQSSLSYTEVMETPPGELPAFLAYRLNGEPLSQRRGGPVRMVVPWAHGFKSIKWLQGMVLTNDYKANDTYAEANNDPESHLKTAAYIGEFASQFRPGETITLGGQVISGMSGLARVEYCVKPESGEAGKANGSAAEVWIECRLEDPPRDWSRVLPSGVSSKSVLGFDRKTGKPLVWPLRYTTISWRAELKGLEPGKYSVRARAVDLNGFAQPEPRPNQKTGKNALDAREFEVMKG